MNRLMNSARYGRIGALLLVLALVAGCSKPSSNAGSGARSPEELLERFEVAMASGDGDAIAALVNSPDDQLIRDKFRHAQEIDTARRELEAALDKAFGPLDDERGEAFGSPIAESVLSATGWKKSDHRPRLEMTIKSQKQQADGTTLLTVDEVFNVDGKAKVKSEKITVMETNGGWKLIRPRDIVSPGIDRFQVEKRITEVLRTCTKEVAGGSFKHRSEAEDLVALELAPLLNPLFGEMSGEGLSATWKEEFRRLGLSPAEPTDIPTPPPVSVRARSAGAGKIGLRIVDAEREVPVDKLTDEFKRSILPVAAPEGLSVDVIVGGGIPADDLLKLFHALVDLRADLLQRLRLTIESPRDLKAIEPKLNGRLKLLVVAGAGQANDPDSVKLDPLEEKNITAEPAADLTLPAEKASPADVKVTPAPDLSPVSPTPLSPTPLSPTPLSPTPLSPTAVTPAPLGLGIDSKTPPSPATPGSPEPTKKKP